MQETLKKIEKIAKKIGREVSIMEVCGTHTQAVSRFGIREILPKNIRLVTGPGCPVCVTAQRDIDAVVNLALSGIPIATYGDALRVPGFYGSLDQAREKGALVFAVYSVAEALEIKKQNSELVFFGLGFETTAPMTAWGIKNNLTVYSAHKIFLPAMEALLRMGELKIDGFLDPGHVSAVIGESPYAKLKIPQVITGFEVRDVLEGIALLLERIQKQDYKVFNQYARVVKKTGNQKMKEILEDVFEIENGEWRGFGFIPKSGMKIRKKYAKLDAKVKYKNILNKIDFSQSKDPDGCHCGEIIRGLKDPKQCPLFGKVCTAENPIGPCMVSVEGACQTAFRYKP